MVDVEIEDEDSAKISAIDAEELGYTAPGLLLFFFLVWTVSLCPMYARK
jgi:hypothetical protein